MSESTRFKKGQVPWNKNIKGIHLSPKSEFKKGVPSWNKNLRGYSNNKKSKGFIDSHGYLVFYSKGKELKAHRIIWEKYYGKIPKGFIVHHRDENKLNNNISNLQLVTRAEHSRIHNLVDKMRVKK